MRRAIALAVAFLISIALADGAFARAGGGVRAGGGARGLGGHSRGGWAPVHLGHGGGVAFRAHRGAVARHHHPSGVRHGHVHHGHRHAGKALRWRYHEGHGWHHHQSAWDGGHGSTAADVSAVASPGNFLADEPGPRFLGSGPALEGIAAVTTRTGVIHPTEDVPAFVRPLHHAPTYRPYFPRRHPGALPLRRGSAIDK